MTGYTYSVYIWIGSYNLLFSRQIFILLEFHVTCSKWKPHQSVNFIKHIPHSLSRNTCCDPYIHIHVCLYMHVYSIWRKDSTGLVLVVSNCLYWRSSTDHVHKFHTFTSAEGMSTGQQLKAKYQKIDLKFQKLAFRGSHACW